MKKRIATFLAQTFIATPMNLVLTEEIGLLKRQVEQLLDQNDRLRGMVPCNIIQRAEGACKTCDQGPCEFVGGMARKANDGGIEATNDGDSELGSVAQIFPSDTAE